MSEFITMSRASWLYRNARMSLLNIESSRTTSQRTGTSSYLRIRSSHYPSVVDTALRRCLREHNAPTADFMTLGISGCWFRRLKRHDRCDQGHWVATRVFEGMACIMMASLEIRNDLRLSMAMRRSKSWHWALAGLLVLYTTRRHRYWKRDTSWYCGQKLEGDGNKAWIIMVAKGGIGVWNVGRN